MKIFLSAVLLVIGVVCVGADPAGSASEKTLVPNNDVGMGSDGLVKDGDSYQVRIGELHAPNGEAYIMPVRVPVLPAGAQIATAHLRMQLAGIAKEKDGADLGSVDLYGLGVRDANKALPADYYEGPTPDPKNTLIQAAFLTPQSKPRTDGKIGPYVETTPAGDAALVKYLNSMCTPANGGKYVILRLSYTKTPIPSGNNAYNVLTTGADGDNEIPVITYTLTPAAK